MTQQLLTYSMQPGASPCRKTGTVYIIWYNSWIMPFLEVLLLMLYSVKQDHIHTVLWKNHHHTTHYSIKAS